MMDHNFFIMRVFHGLAYISEIKLGRKIEIKTISFKNLRSKKIILPEQYYKYILNKLNEWANIYHDWGNINYGYSAFDSSQVPVDVLDEIMFTVAMNEKHMVLALQHPSDTPTKKKGWEIATGRLDRATNGKSYLNKHNKYPKWLVHMNTEDIVVE